jgi:hypothetical protein
VVVGVHLRAVRVLGLVAGAFRALRGGLLRHLSPSCLIAAIQFKRSVGWPARPSTASAATLQKRIGRATSAAATGT